MDRIVFISVNHTGNSHVPVQLVMNSFQPFKIQTDLRRILKLVYLKMSYFKEMAENEQNPWKCILKQRQAAEKELKYLEF